MERDAGFWWHGDVTSQHGWSGHPVPANFTAHLKFGAHAGAFDRYPPSAASLSPFCTEVELRAGAGIWPGRPDVV